MTNRTALLGLATIPMLVLVATVAGCGAVGESPPSERDGSSREAIVGGTLSPAERNSTVYVEYDAGGYKIQCGGALVAPNLVMVVRQCVAETVFTAFQCQPNGEPVDDGNGGGYVLYDYDPKGLHVYVGETMPDHETEPDAGVVKVFHDGSNTLCSHNFAIMLLDRSLDTPFAPIRFPEQVEVDERLTVAGWGTSEGELVPSERRERANVPVLEVGPLTIDPKATTGSTPRRFVTGPAICFGDGGAVAYASSGAVVGIASGGAGFATNGGSMDPGAPCLPATAQGLFTQVAGFPSVLAEAFEAAGTEPWLENGPHPSLGKFGEACETNADCRSDLCTDGSDGPPYCSQTCAESAACPAGFECVKDAAPSCRVPAGIPAPSSEMAAAGGACSVAPGAAAPAPFGVALAALAHALLRRRSGARARRA